MVKLKKPGEKATGRIFLICAALLWGLAGVCVKSIPWNSMSIMSARCFIASIILAISNKSFKMHFSKMNVLGAIFQSLTGILYMSSIKLTTAATAIVLQYIAPILVYLYSIIFQKVKPKLTEALIVLMVFGGCVLSFADDIDASHILGNILGVASGFAFAGQIIVFSDKRANSGDAMYIGNFFSCIICLPFMFFDSKMSETNLTVIIWIIILGVFQYGLANLCYTKGCQKVSKLEGSLLLTIEPIWNPVPTFFATGELMGPLALAGFIIVIAGITLYALLPVIENKIHNRRIGDENSL